MREWGVRKNMKFIYTSIVLRGKITNGINLLFPDGRREEIITSTLGEEKKG